MSGLGSNARLTSGPSDPSTRLRNADTAGLSIFTAVQEQSGNFWANRLQRPLVGHEEVPVMKRPPERRDVTKRRLISAQLTSILSSPSVVLTVQEAKRLLGVSEEACDRILQRLENSGLLRQVQRGTYVPTPLIAGLA